MSNEIVRSRKFESRSVNFASLLPGLGLLFASSFLVAFSYGVIGWGEKAGLVAVESTLNFGTTPEGMHERSFSVRNVDSQSPVVIERIETACSCEKVMAPPRVEPGETIELPIKWNVTGLNGETRSALRIIWRFEKADLSRSLPIVLEANVTPDFLIEPIGSMTLYSKTPRDSGEVIIVPKRLVDCHFKGVTCSHPLVSVELLDPKRVRVHISDRFKSGRGSDTAQVILSTNSSYRPVVGYTVFLK